MLHHPRVGVQRREGRSIGDKPAAQAQTRGREFVRQVHDEALRRAGCCARSTILSNASVWVTPKCSAPYKGRHQLSTQPSFACNSSGPRTDQSSFRIVPSASQSRNKALLLAANSSSVNVSLDSRL